VCRRVVDAHDGTITVHSTPGKGSTFVITLPVHRGDGPDAPRQEAQPLAAPAKEGRR